MRGSSGIQLKFLTLIFLILGMTFGSINICRADEEAIRAEIAGLRAMIQQLEEKLNQQEEKAKGMEKIKGAFEGFSIGAGGTMIVQGANNVDYSGDGHTLKESRADGSYSADITIGKEFKEVGGKAFLHLEAGQGAGLEDNLVLYSNVNRDAGNSEARVEATEFWYGQALFKDRAAFTFGKLDPTAYFDQNEVANDETTQFLGRIFRNSPTIEFPDNGAGIQLAYLPVEWLELGYGIFDGNGDWEKIGDNLFNIGQVHFKTNFFDLPGNYCFYGWHNNVYHTKWSDVEKTKEAAYGFGLSLDQKITDIITLFTRYGWQNPKIYNSNITATGESNYSLEHSWSVGLQLEGKPWGRENDVLALAVGQVIPSDDYKDYYGYLAKSEGHLETYYKINVNDHLSISPDFQYIWNPFGKDVADDTDGIFVGGMRAQVDF
jgi:hypothetical protein